METSVDKIDSGLNKIFQGLEGSYIKSNNANRIVLTGLEHVSQAQALIQALAKVSPGRFFLIIYSGQQKKLSVDLSAFCSAHNKNQSVCSEIISITSDELNIYAAPSIVRAHLLTGRRAELAVFPGFANQAVFDDLTRLAEYLLIDSYQFWKDGNFLQKCIADFQRVIDMQWLLIAPWREAIRNAFEMPALQAQLINLCTITINGPKTNAGLPLELLAGWLCHCLKLNVSVYNSRGFECSSANGLVIKIQLKYSDKEPQARGVSSLQFKFKSPTETLDFRLGTDQRLHVQIANKILAHEKIDSCEPADALARYFAVGESSVFYAESLKLGLEISQLKRGFL